MKPTRVLVLHSHASPDAPPHEQDTLHQVDAIADALASRGHAVAREGWPRDEAVLAELVERHRSDVIFNLVEFIDQAGALVVEVPLALERIGVKYTGSGHRALVITGDKPAAKRALREAGMPTPAWAEAPDWLGLPEGAPVIVKSALEDNSLGLDDGSIVMGISDVRARARACADRYGGRWFAEAYVDGREFNVAVLEVEGSPRVLPLVEMKFVAWPEGRPKILGYQAKWLDDWGPLARAFGLEAREPDLARTLVELSQRAWALFDLRGYARIDFRVDEQGAPSILEINPNPSLALDAGFAAAAANAGLSYEVLVERIMAAALGERSSSPLLQRLEDGAHVLS